MDLGTFFSYVVHHGAECDPRADKKSIRSYADSGILYGDPATPVKRMMVGIDIEVPEILLADRLRGRHQLDLVVAHHPEGKPFARLADVMTLQSDVLIKAGVPADTANQLLQERMWEVDRKLLAANHTRAVDAARLLGLPFVCMHTPADNNVYDFLQKLVDKAKPKRVKDIVDLLMSFEEYQEAAKTGTQPRVIFGNQNMEAGKILVDMTGGTEGHQDVFDKLYKAGVRTMLCMHLSEDHLRKVKETQLSVIIAGHISSDSLGMNLLLDKVEGHADEHFDVVSCSGFKRVRRNGRSHT